MKRGDNAHAWFVNVHHIIMDGWSWNRLLLPLISECYQCLLQGTPFKTARKFDFKVFSSWEKRYLESEKYLMDRRFWEYKRRTAYEPMALYGKYPAKESTGLDRTLFKLGEKRTRRIKKIAGTGPFLSKNRNVAVLNILATLLFTFLHKISGNKRLVVGIPFHNRKPGITSDTIGLLMQTLPLGIFLAEEETFVSLFEKITHDLTLMRKHGDYTLSNPHDNPNYDVLLNFISLTKPAFGKATVRGGWTGAGHGYESLGFIVIGELSDANLEVGFDFHGDVFEKERQAQAVDHFLNLMDSFLENQDQKITHADILSKDEKNHIIRGLNHTRKQFPENRTVIQLFEQAALAYPDNIAVVFESQRITYRELDRKAQKIGNFLSSRGLGAEEGAGLLMNRSIELIISLLGVLKAGCFYVPIDPEYPEERKNFIIKDADIKIVLTDGNQEYGRFKNTQDITPLLSRDSKRPVMVKPAPAEHAVYVTYTSGSTGMPKGVVVENRSLVNAYYAWEDAYKLKQTNVHLQMANFTFDVFSGDLVRGVCSGARLVICLKETLADPETLYRLMVEENIDCAEFVPVVLRQLMDYVGKLGKNLGFMKIICCGSDTWYNSEYRAFLNLCGEQTRLINSFGAPVQLNFHTEDGSATLADQDYVSKSGTITIDPSTAPLPTWDV
ncbi:MAG: AMP-binding protein, partial [Proteobacteria bacterium]|nr:AMP-binding protein [Pseudomonadota bacterium]